jgi:hypothetical protein
MLEYNLIVLEQVRIKLDYGSWERIRKNAIVYEIELVGVLWIIIDVKI